MTDPEYIMVSNKEAIWCAIECLRQVLPGGEYGVDSIELSKAINILTEQRSNLYDKIVIRD